jgi:hypothetical protein
MKSSVKPFAAIARYDPLRIMAGRRLDFDCPRRQRHEHRPEDDLEATAELPQLDMQAASIIRSGWHGRYRLFTSAAACRHQVRSREMTGDSHGIDSTGSWPTIDELISVRDKIMDLEAALVDAGEIGEADKQCYRRYMQR